MSAVPGRSGSLDALAFAHDGDDVPLAFVGEEVLETNAEDECDAKQCWQRGIQFVALELG